MSAPAAPVFPPAMQEQVFHGDDRDDGDDDKSDDDDSDGDDDDGDDNGDDGDDDYFDSFDELHGERGDADDDDESGGDEDSGGNKASQPQGSPSEAQRTREVDAALVAEIASVFNVASCADTSSPVQEVVDDDGGINYSPNPDTPEREMQRPSEEPVVALPAKTVQK